MPEHRTLTDVPPTGWGDGELCQAGHREPRQEAKGWLPLLLILRCHGGVSHVLVLGNATCSRLQLGALHWATSVNYCK